MMGRFLIDLVMKNGHPHYKVYDKVTDQTVYCNKGDLNKIIWKALGV